jgi:hypothetical protein
VIAAAASRISFFSLFFHCRVNPGISSNRNLRVLDRASACPLCGRGGLDWHDCFDLIDRRMSFIVIN